MKTFQLSLILSRTCLMNLNYPNECIYQGFLGGVFVLSMSPFLARARARTRARTRARAHTQVSRHPSPASRELVALAALFRDRVGGCAASGRHGACDSPARRRPSGQGGRRRVASGAAVSSCTVNRAGGSLGVAERRPALRGPGRNLRGPAPGEIQVRATRGPRPRACLLYSTHAILQYQREASPQGF